MSMITKTKYLLIFVNYLIIFFYHQNWIVGSVNESFDISKAGIGTILTVKFL